MASSDTLRLSQLAAQVERVVSNAFSAIQFWVIADISNYNHKPGTTFHSFELIEKVPGTDNLLAKFSGRAWGDGAQHIALFESRTGQKFGNDIQVLVRVKVYFHATYGLQLQLTDIDHTFTLGVLEKQRQQTLEKLCRENPQYIKKDGDDYWTKNKSLRLPVVIQKIAVVTGKTSAGWQDFHHTLETNQYLYKFSITPYFTDVQGEDKALAMQSALVDIFQSSTQYDLVVIIRGGGAQSDLLLFDHYLVGRAIARFPVPVFTGIGHQKNITIADMMAHTSLKTPTKVADAIINHNKLFEDQLVTIQKTILIKAQQTLSTKTNLLNATRSLIINSTYILLSDYKHELAAIRQAVIDNGREIPFRNRVELSNLTSTMFSKPKIIMGSKNADLKNVIGNIKSYQAGFLRNASGYLGHFISYFDAVSPVNTLKRGFAMVKYNDNIISDPEQLKKGDTFTVIMRTTELHVQLNSKKEYNGK